MFDDHDGHDPAVDGSTPGFHLGFAVADRYADLRVTPVLRRLLTHSRELLQTVAGSVSLVDPARGSYAKVAESGAACQLGQTFPLHEGATGQAFAHRRPVVIDNYGDLAAGHLPEGHPAGRGAAAAVPLWWRGEVIGVNVAFAGARRRFTAAEIDAFEVLTQSVGVAVVEAGAAVPSLAGLLHEHGRIRAGATGVQTVVTEVGAARPVRTGVATAAADLVALVGHAVAVRAGTRQTGPSRLHVVLVHRPEGLRLLVQDEAAEAVAAASDPLGLGTSTWTELLAVTGVGLGGRVGVEHVPGWGTLLRADFPDVAVPTAPADEPSPLTPREVEVLRLLADGLSDREVAARLTISPKTVEKHVGAVLRKTDTASRTAAVVQALDRGWVGEHKR
jgi:DNA-binding CsgD family transcriptional regulator